MRTARCAGGASRGRRPPSESQGQGQGQQGRGGGQEAREDAVRALLRRGAVLDRRRPGAATRAAARAAACAAGNQPVACGPGRGRRRPGGASGAASGACGRAGAAAGAGQPQRALLGLPHLRRALRQRKGISVARGDVSRGARDTGDAHFKLLALVACYGARRDIAIR